MDGMTSATGAELFNSEFLGLTLFVLAGDVVAPFASIALKTNQISHVSPSAALCQPAR
jgi:hypothetical protein